MFTYLCTDQYTRPSAVFEMAMSFDQHRDEIADLCRTYGVERLEAFGSAVTEEFDDETSDLDFVVRFDDRSPGYADRFLDFAEALEQLFGREVDLVTERSIQNPFFRCSVDDSRQVIYDQSSQETTA